MMPCKGYVDLDWMALNIPENVWINYSDNASEFSICHDIFIIILLKQLMLLY